MDFSVSVEGFANTEITISFLEHTYRRISFEIIPNKYPVYYSHFAVI